MSIFVGSVIMVVGALLQGFAQHSMSNNSASYIMIILLTYVQLACTSLRVCCLVLVSSSPSSLVLP
jgi:hypothetical protein